MRKTVLITSLLIMTVLMATSLMAAPRLVIPESAFDFGYVPQNAKVSHQFWLHSKGQDSLKILKIVPGWGCTKAPLEKSEIAVGDSTYVEIIFSTKKYSSKVSKRPKIQTNEGPPDKRVQIIATVVPRPDSTYPATIRPYKLDLSQFTEKVRDEIIFSIYNVSDKELKLNMIADYKKYFKVDLPSSISPGATAEGKLTLTNFGKENSFEKSFTIEMDDEKQSRFTIPVKRTIRKPTPQKLGSK